MAFDWESELPALAALSDQEAADAINAMTVEVRSEYRVTYRTVLAVTKDPARTEAVAAAIKSQMPTIDGMLREYGDAGGVDVSFAETRAFIQSLVGAAAYQLTQEQADAICGLGVEVRQKYTFHVGPHHVAVVRAGGTI